MPAKQFRDPETGEVVLVEDGKVQMRNEQGMVLETPLEQYRRARLDNPSLLPATAADIDAYEREDSALEQAGTFAESAAAGAIDVAQLPARAVITPAAKALGFGDPFAQLGGRGTLENLAAIAGEAVPGDQTGEAVAREYSEGARERSEQYPVTSMLGRVTGEIAAGAPLTRGAQALSKALLERTVAKGYGATVGLAAEGAALGLSQAGEEAWLQDEELTAERAWSGVGLGAAAGGVLGLASRGAQRLLRRGDTAPVTAPREGQGARQIEEVFGESPKRARTEDFDEAFQQTMGVEAAPGLANKARKAAEDIQAIASGGDPATIRKYGALRWDDEAIEGGQMWLDRPKIIEGATEEVVTQFDDLLKARQAITEEVVQQPLKRDHVGKNLVGVDRQQALSFAKTKATQLVDDTKRRVGVPQLSEEAIASGAKPPRLSKAQQDQVGWAERVAREIELADAPSDAYIALDQARRELYREYQATQRSISRKTNAAAIRSTQERADMLRDQYLDMAESLFDTQVWGAQGAAQREVNTAWVDYINAQETGFSKFVAPAGRTFDQRPLFRTDPNKIQGYLDGLGRQKNKLIDEDFRAQLSNTRNLVDSISAAYDIPAPRLKDLSRVRESVDRIQKTLEKADRTVAVSNQIDDLITAGKQAGDITGPLAYGGVGALLGGPIGALAGAAYGAAVNPGRMIAVRAQLVKMARSSDGRIGNALKSTLRKAGVHVGDQVERGPNVGARAAPKTRADRNPMAFAPPGPERRTQFTERARFLAENQASGGQLVASRFAEASSELASTSPGVYRSMVLKSAMAFSYLAQHMPKSVQDPELQRLGIEGVSNSEIDEFAARWDGVLDPESLVEDMEDGFVHPAKVEAVKQTNPRMFAEMQRRALDMMAQLQTPPPYETRLKFDLALELNGSLEPSLSPERMGLMARIGQLMMQEAEALGSPPAGVAKLTVSRATRSQQIAQGGI